MSRILVVDDEPGMRASFEKMLAAEGYEVATAGAAEPALELVRQWRPELLIMDIRMPGMDGLTAFRRLKEESPRLPVIIITGYGTAESAIEATKLGAFDYHLKPFDPPKILESIRRALQGVRLMERGVALGSDRPAPESDALVGQSQAMREVYMAIGRVALTDATVLLRGETGTGKELVARAIYQHSRRSRKPLLIVNCVAIPEPLLEAELFGHEKGAFTGAHTRRLGKFEQADGGTILLDEIGDVPPGIQAKILRVLQERTFERIGGSETLRADVRVLAATNRDLEQAIADREFREDLYHRLNVVTISIPPLRERREDIPRLVDYFLETFRRDLGIERPSVAPEARERLMDYPWPGNVRELEHCIHRALIFTRGYPIQLEDVERALQQGARAGAEAHDGPSGAPPGSAATALPSDPALPGGREDRGGVHTAALRRMVRHYLREDPGSAAHARFLETVDRLLVHEALRLTRGNQTRAARLLGITRPTLQAKAAKHGLRKRTEYREEPEEPPAEW